MYTIHPPSKVWYKFELLLLLLPYCRHHHTGDRENDRKRRGGGVCRVGKVVVVSAAVHTDENN
jgi:hypothetical protein